MPCSEALLDYHFPKIELCYLRTCLPLSGVWHVAIIASCLYLHVWFAKVRTFLLCDCIYFTICYHFFSFGSTQPNSLHIWTASLQGWLYSWHSLWEDLHSSCSSRILSLGLHCEKHYSLPCFSFSWSGSFWLGSVITGSIMKTQSFNLDRDAKATIGKTNVKVEQCTDQKAAEEDRKKKNGQNHSGLDYALNGRLIPRPICLLATIRRSVTRPDWKWLFFQTLLKCVCVSPITWLLLIKLKSPLQSQCRASPFPFSFFFFIPKVKQKYLWDLVSAGSAPWNYDSKQLPCDHLDPVCSLHLT